MLRISGESVSNHHGARCTSQHFSSKIKPNKSIVVIRNAIVVSLQYAQNQRGKRFKSSWCMVHESLHESVLFKQDQAKQVKIAIRNAIVVSMQYAQNQRGKRVK